jgi:serpin B
MAGYIGKSSEIVTNNIHLNSTISNYISSPVNILIALLYLLNGSNGDTRKELLNFLKINECDIRTLTNTAIKFVNSITNTSNVKIVNLFLLSKEIEPNNEFKNIANKLGEYIGVDFMNNSSTIIDKVNRIIEHTTDGNITNMVNNQMVNPGTKLLIVNTLYVKLEWNVKFTRSKTHRSKFTNIENKVQYIYMMSRDKDNFIYNETDEYQIVIIPCRHKFSAVFILPREGNNEILKKCFIPSIYLADMKERRGSVSIPRFKVENDLDILNILKKAGLNKVFSINNAEFHGMVKDPKENSSKLFVNDMKHKIVIEMSETGIKASAVTLTSLDVSYNGMSVKETGFTFNANRTFRYQILQDSDFGQIVMFDGIYDGQGISEDCDTNINFSNSDLKIRKDDIAIRTNQNIMTYGCIFIILMLIFGIFYILRERY